MENKIHLGILYGGKSGEHEVSIQTAFSVINALDFQRYQVTPIYITLSGTWIQGTPLEKKLSSAKELRLEENHKGGYLDPFTQPGQQETMPAYFQQVRQPLKYSALPLMVQQSISSEAPQTLPLDVIFPLLHGPNGEDGTVQGMLELADIPYVGSEVLASAVGMDKGMMKTVFAQHQLPQVDYLLFTRPQWERQRKDVLERVEKELGYPCFIKPANLGSSVGISKAKNREELVRSIDLAAQFDRRIVIEAFVDAREIEMAVLGNETPMTSVPGEILPGKEFYDYEAKYTDGKSSLVIPADLPPEIVQELSRLAVSAFCAIDACGLARVDFFLRRSDQQVLINEINTMPGFTRYSMYPLLWQHSGIPYPELIDRLIHLAIERYQDKKRNRIEPD